MAMDEDDRFELIKDLADEDRIIQEMINKKRGK